MNVPEAVALYVLSSLMRPVIFVPSIALGWFARRWWQVVAAAILIALAWFAFILLKGLPPGGKVGWAARPLMVVAPLAWCSAGFLLRRLWDARATPVGKVRFRRVIYVLLGFVLGGVVGVVGGFAIGSAHVTAAHVSSFEGLSGYVVVGVRVRVPGCGNRHGGWRDRGVAAGPAVGGNLILNSGELVGRNNSEVTDT